MIKMKLKFTELNPHVSKKTISIAVLIILFTIIFAASILIRIYLFDNTSLPGKEAHFNVNTAKDLSSFKKSFVVGEMAVQELLWPLLIASVSLLFRIPQEISIIMLSFLFGIASIILIYFIIEKMNFKKKNMAMAFFLISPVTIWLFSTFSKFIIPFFFSLLAIYYLLSDKKFLAILAVALVSLFGLVSSLSVLALCFLAYKKEFWKWFIQAFSISFAINIGLYILSPYIGIFNFNFSSIFSIFFALSEVGVNMFAFLLGFMGIFMTWKERKERKELFLVYLVFVLLFIFSITNKDFVFFFNFILIFLASIGFLKLLERDWTSDLIKKLTILILVIGLVIPLIFMPIRIAYLQPDDSLIESLTFLKSQEDGKVFGVKENGFWIRSFSDKEPFIDEFKAQVKPEIDEKAMSLFYERNIDSLVNTFNEEGIKYVLVDSKMRHLFRTDDEGIMLLLTRSFKFTKIYDKDNIQIWKLSEETIESVNRNL